MVLQLCIIVEGCMLFLKFLVTVFGVHYYSLRIFNLDVLQCNCELGDDIK
jgi:hypothetical protein